MRSKGALPAAGSRSRESAERFLRVVLRGSSALQQNLQLAEPGSRLDARIAARGRIFAIQPRGIPLSGQDG